MTQTAQHESHAAPQSQLNPTNIVLVASGKGGVGKTWFSISFASALAKLGQNVLLFDGDLGLANVDIQLGLTPDVDLGHYISGKASFTDAISTKDTIPFDIIAGRSGSGTLSSLSSQRFTLLKSELKKIAASYDTIIIDLGAGIGKTVQNLSELASNCYVITTDEPTSMTDAYAFIKVTRQYLPELEISLIVNQAESESEGRKTYETLKNVSKNFLHFTPELTGMITRDKKVKDAIKNQVSILVRHPDSDASKDVINIAKKYLKEKSQA